MSSSLDCTDAFNLIYVLISAALFVVCVPGFLFSFGNPANATVFPLHGPNARSVFLHLILFTVLLYVIATDVQRMRRIIVEHTE